MGYFYDQKQWRTLCQEKGAGGRVSNGGKKELEKQEVWGLESLSARVKMDIMGKEERRKAVRN